MTDLDLRLRDELDVLFPEPRRAPRWEDVVARARAPLRRRPLVLALAAVVVVLASAAAVTAALGGFDAWLGGQPGKPAPAEEQARFEAANGRTWAAFPKSTRLRELIRTKVQGKTYVLFGFRSGSTLCLKLKAVSLGHSSAPACTPAATLAHATAPIVVVVEDSGFDDRHAHPSAEVSFGIAADGVRRVDVRAVDGQHRAVVGGNAYLFVENEPNTGNRVLGVSAVGADGRRASISLGTTFGDPFRRGGSRQARGPAHADVKIRNPTIGWVVRGERRGFGVERLSLTPTGHRELTPAARFVKPDPYSDIVVGVDGTYCLVLVEGRGFGESCSPRAVFFSRGPINVVSSGGGGLTSATIAGAVADGIKRVVVFGADGQRIAAPLRDNLFALRVGGAQWPARVVGYDARGRIAGVETLSFGLAGGVPPAAARRHLRVVRRVPGPNGATALLRVGPVVGSLRCWRVDLSTSQRPSGCVGTIPTGPWISADLVQPAGRDLFVIGHVRDPVVRVRLRFADGDAITTRPVKGLFVLAIPRAHLSDQRQFAFVLGLDGRGAVHQRQGVLFKLPS
jgi:hypothetical protein